MNRKRHFIRASLLAALFVGSACVNAGTLFQDSFEGGKKGAAQNGFSWADTTDGVAVSSAQAKTGSYSLAFPFAGVPMGGDSFEEQRVRFGKSYGEMWVKYDLYVPSNYNHRSDGASNNKFFAIFNNDYQPGWQVNFSLGPDSGGGSHLEIHYYKDGHEQSVIRGNTLIASGDLGKWHRIVMHFKVSSSSGASNGVQELWKDGTAIYSNKALDSYNTGMNYMDEAYILGWANSGFTQTTTLYIDDVVFSDTPIPATADGKSPAAPVLNSVQ